MSKSEKMYPSTINDPKLTEMMGPTILAAAGDGNVLTNPLITGAEDFSFYQREKPGLFISLGGMKKRGRPNQNAVASYSRFLY